MSIDFLSRKKYTAKAKKKAERKEENIESYWKR